MSASQERQEKLTLDDDAPVFQCQVCKSDFTNPYVSLDRNTQQHGTDVWQGKVRKTINIRLSQEMFRYDSQHCWSLHAPEIEAALQLKATYSPSAWLQGRPHFCQTDFHRG